MNIPWIPFLLCGTLLMADSPPLSATLSPQGAIAVSFRSSHTLRSQAAVSDIKGPWTLPVLSSPVADLSLQNHRQWVQLDVALQPEPGKEPVVGNILLSRLEAEKLYDLVLTWDVETRSVDLYLNGVLQTPLFIIAQRYWETPPPLEGPVTLHGTLDTPADSPRLHFGDLKVYDTRPTAKTIRARAEDLNIPPLQGEGRTMYDRPLDLENLVLEPLFEADFTRPLRIIHEEELFEGDKRVRTPNGHDWVLEGSGRATATNGWLTLEAERDPDDQSVWLEKGHLVLWINRAFPQDILIDYELSPRNSEKGLNIVFFNCRPRAQGVESIFDLSLKRRGGNFGSYLWHDLNNYHISVWACPKVIRRTTNMRKNRGFQLTAVGNDPITGAGPGPHRVRILRHGNLIQAETMGVLSLEYRDDGVTHGPVLKDGYIGIRMMAQTESMRIRNLRVYQVTENRANNSR